MTRRKTGNRKAGRAAAGRNRGHGPLTTTGLPCGERATPAILRLDLQVKSRAAHVPSRRDAARWISEALAGRVDAAKPVEVTLRIVGPTEMRALNRAYRGKDYATNVLSFAFGAPDGVDLPVNVLGDIVLCAATVRREAREQGKDTRAHWAHLVVHGTLHLLGMDHMARREAARMESAEIDVLRRLGLDDPYQPRPEEP